MTKATIINRQQQLKESLIKNSFIAAALNPGPDLTYFTGLDFHLMERPVIGIFPAEGTPILILPELEQQKLNKLDYEIRAFFYTEDQSTWQAVITNALIEAGLESGNLGVIPRQLRVLELRYLEEAGPDLDIISAELIISSLRMVKADHEIELMQEAARIAECALSATLSAIKPGVTEKEIASKLVGRLLQYGSAPELPFFPIVSFGPNSANPHASPSNRVLKLGDLVLVDWGANTEHYFSDITRTFAMGDVNPELEQIAEFVRKANAAGRSAVKAGISSSAVDLAVRKVIDDAGYGEYFIHRTGHGLGRETHEEPYISEYEDTILKPGMVFTIEPGIYLPNRGGVRIEDDVVVTEDGCKSLTHQPRELTQLFFEE
ncbi:MAG: Xaa-Pro peptidase family protein [Anaerolineales bacterium]|nr:Xaa-Pro peptidase family protein [Anaerolineales bacterium]